MASNYRWIFLENSSYSVRKIKILKVKFTCYGGEFGHVASRGSRRSYLSSFLCGSGGSMFSICTISKPRGLMETRVEMDAGKHV